VSVGTAVESLVVVVSAGASTLTESSLDVFSVALDPQAVSTKLRLNTAKIDLDKFFIFVCLKFPFIPYLSKGHPMQKVFFFGLPSFNICIKPTLLIVYYFDELIVSEIRKKNEVALRELYKTNYPMIVNLICSNSGTEQEAKDIYQEAVIAFYEKLQEPDFTLTCRIKTYLYAVCRRLWLKRLAGKKRFRGSIPELETFAGIETEIEDIEEKEIKFNKMNAALQGLGEPCKSIIEEFYIKDQSMEAISAKFGYTNADNAKNQKYKCLQRLKKLFFQNDNDSAQ
jgi:RNA polymerase sigma factor (sigma-70 family)